MTAGNKFRYMIADDYNAGQAEAKKLCCGRQFRNKKWIFGALEKKINFPVPFLNAFMLQCNIFFGKARWKLILKKGGDCHAHIVSGG